MPPPLLFDLDSVDLDQVYLSQQEIYTYLPHRHEFMLLHGVSHADLDARHLVCFRDIAEDDWWVRGHVPGRALLPGVLMLEIAAQGSAVLANLITGDPCFVVFGGADNCKFREAVEPGCRLSVLCASREIRARRVVSDVQGIVNGRQVFEATITGMITR